MLVGRPRRSPEASSRRRWHVPGGPLSRAGMMGAVLFFSLSLLPSMLPRTGLVQGAVSGITAALGYAVSTSLRWLVTYLELPAPSGRVRQALLGVGAALLAVVLALSVWRHVGWQNEVRGLFGMEAVSPTAWLAIVPVGVLVAGLLLLLARGIRRVFRAFTRWLDGHLPRRVAILLGGAATVMVLAALWSGVLVNGFFALANHTFAPIDTRSEEGVTPPTSALRSGSPASIVAWDTLGRMGRRFVAGGPSVDQLNAHHGAGAREPIRVYAGIRSAEDLEGRAELVLAELKRAGAFDREVLVVATTTGTGFLEPNAVDSLEYVHNGDTAIAGVQYSYLPSWISLLADQDEVRAASRVVFDTIHGYWSTLPDAARPEIYLYGLSLGSYGVESILASINVINEPIDGALMVGPPFVNELWNELVDNRDPGTSPALPVYGQGRTVRFMGESAEAALPADGWGDTRVLYLQHASDPVTFFSPDLLLSRPDWLQPGQRGPDIAERFTWIPLVTMWQVLLDLPAGGSVPEGFGHLFTREANADAWADVTRPDGWTEADRDALHDHLRATYGQDGPVEG
jgi:uncharacterized membrane protein